MHRRSLLAALAGFVGMGSSAIASPAPTQSDWSKHVQGILLRIFEDKGVVEQIGGMPVKRVQARCIVTPEFHTAAILLMEHCVYQNIYEATLYIRSSKKYLVSEEHFLALAQQHIAAAKNVLPYLATYREVSAARFRELARTYAEDVMVRYDPNHMSAAEIDTIFHTLELEA